MNSRGTGGSTEHTCIHTYRYADGEKIDFKITALTKYILVYLKDPENNTKI